MKDIFNELSKIKLEEIKIGKPNIVFKIIIPKEWEEKTIQDNEEFNKFLLDFYSFNTKFFSYLSSEIGEDIKEYITSILSDYLYNKYPMSPTLLSFDIIKEGVWYYFIKLGINKIIFYNTDIYDEFSNLIVKQFDKRIINLDLVEDFFKANTPEVQESKVSTPLPSIDPIPLHLKYSIIPELKNILEYTNQDTLNPNVFDGLQIKPKVREVLLKIANYFWECMEVDAPYEDILLLGSSANYNWTENSDIDVHILFNFSLSNQDSEDFRKYADSFTQNFNTTYDFKIKNNPIQLYVQDVTEENHSVGVYSIVNSEWVQEPVKEKVDIPEEQIQKYAEIFKKKIDDIINSSNGNTLEKIKQLKDEIKDFRQKGLDSSEGEYSIENLVFKELRNSGYLEKLYNWKTEYLNQKLSIPEVGEANAEPYNWEKVNDDTYSFTTEQDLKYIVELLPYEDHEDKITVDFGIDQDGDISHPETNAKDLFKVMSTIVDIIKNYVETHSNVNTIIFSSIAKSGEIKRGETQRDRLYKTFFKKQLNISDDDIILRNGNYWVDISKQKESLTEGKKEDTKQNIIELSKFLKEKLELPYLPKVKFINNDSENEKNPLGKTAYYDPNTKTVVLYTLGRHPKDITRSFSHEVIHFKQDLDGRLNNITTQNVNEDEYLAELEREAYEKGNMLLRSWENGRKLNEIKISTPDSTKSKIVKVISKKDTEYFDADTAMYLLDLGKYYTFVPHGGDYNNPAYKLYLIDKDIVEKTKDQNDLDLIRFNNDLKSFDLKNHIEQISKNGIEYIK